MYTLVDSSFESETESVKGGFPAHDPSGPSFAGRVERPDSEVDTFEGGLLVREMATGTDRTSDPGVERFDGVRSMAFVSGMTVGHFGSVRDRPIAWLYRAWGVRRNR